MSLSSPGAPTHLLEKFARSFRKSTGLPVHLFRPGEFSVGEEEGIPDFCRVMAKGRKSCASCRELHLKLQDPEAASVKTIRCFAGLTSSAVPVRREGKVLGYLHTGHAYVDQKPGCGQPGRGCVLPGRKEGGFPCSGACRKTLCLSKDRYEGAVGLLEIFSAQLASLPTPPNGGATYPGVDHLLRQLRADPTRPWRMSDCARMAGMHPTYFSEKFHQQTGATFTSFLATLRVEKARQLLHYTGLPISEVAFASGFRSLSQFNRVFKKITGQAPSAER